jgi:hypothetical protein
MTIPPMPPLKRGENLLKVPLFKGEARGIVLSLSAIRSTLKTRPTPYFLDREGEMLRG